MRDQGGCPSNKKPAGWAGFAAMPRRGSDGRAQGAPVRLDQAATVEVCGTMRGKRSAMASPVKLATQPSLLVNRRIATK